MALLNRSNSDELDREAAAAAAGEIALSSGRRKHQRTAACTSRLTSVSEHAHKRALTNYTHAVTRYVHICSRDRGGRQDERR